MRRRRLPTGAPCGILIVGMTRLVLSSFLIATAASAGGALAGMPPPPPLLEFAESVRPVPAKPGQAPAAPPAPPAPPAPSASIQTDPAEAGAVAVMRLRV